MGISGDTPSLSRKLSVGLLMFAWVMALASLAGPAEDAPVILLLFRLPVYLLIGAAFVAPIEAQTRFMAWVAVAAILFVLSPMALTQPVSRRRNLIQRFLSVGLLGAWAFPIVVELIAKPQVKVRWGFQHVAWGYYLYAIAHTFAFIAIHFGLWAEPKTVRRRGFPITPIRNQTGQARFSSIESQHGS